MRQDNPGSRVPSEFAPDAGGGDTTSANTMVVAAYLLLWVILMAFIAMNWRRQRAIADRLSQVEKAVDKAASGSTAAD